MFYSSTNFEQGIYLVYATILAIKGFYYFHVIINKRLHLVLKMFESNLLFNLLKLDFDKSVSI